MLSPSDHTRFCTAALTAAMLVVLTVSAFSVPVASVESVMSSEQSHKPFLSFLDRLIAEQHRRGLSDGKTLDINAMDALDPVHRRAARSRHLENDYDGDLGRDHADALRDNGRPLPVSGGNDAHNNSWIKLGDAPAFAEATADKLPVIEAPSIVGELPATETEKEMKDVSTD